MTYVNFQHIQRIIPLQSSVAFHIETSHLICSANQMTGFYMKFDTGVKLVNLAHFKIDFALVFVNWTENGFSFGDYFFSLCKTELIGVQRVSYGLIIVHICI